MVSDYARVAVSCGGRRHHPRRMLPHNRWTFDVSVRRGSAGTIALGRWTFGRHRGIEAETGRLMLSLGHVGEYRYMPVGCPDAAYYIGLSEIYRDIQAKADDPKAPVLAFDHRLRAGDRDGDGEMGGELSLRGHSPRRGRARVG